MQSGPGTVRQLIINPEAKYLILVMPDVIRHLPPAWIPAPALGSVQGSPG